MTFVAGQPKIGGRTAGTPNKMTAELREAVFDAFDQAGGVEYLVRVAKERPDVFLRLLARLIPTQLKVESQGVTLEELLEPMHLRRVQRLAAQRDGAMSAAGAERGSEGQT